MEMVHFIPPSQRRLVMLAAQADTAPVLISGASGTGKGGIARWIHENGPRVSRPFVVARHDQPLSAQIPLAQGGTILIPEIGEWPLAEQKALLTFLKTKSIASDNPVVPMLLNVRVMANSSQTLEGRAQAGLFNPELLQKLNVFRIEMPPLSKRSDEFEDIVLGIIGEITREIHKEHLRGPSAEAWDGLKSYGWPGNLRELRNVLRLAVVAAKGDHIETFDLPALGSDRIDFHATREQFEKIYILELLKTFDWELDRTCQMSKMDRNTLLTKMQRYGIDPKGPSEKQISH
jgi:DNA-binding NtrC family response regulator